MDTLTWTDLWAQCTELLGSSDEARWIIEEASGRSGASWLITLTTSASSAAESRVMKMVERRLSGEPLQYVLGNWAFRQLNLHVDKRVLIPRPETEQVTQQAIDMIHEVTSPVVFDLGTGSGAIAFSIALEVHDATVYAVDLSLDALEVAEINLRRLPLPVQQRVHLVQGSWFEGMPSDLEGKVDLIVSNPPYISTSTTDVDSSVASWEPRTALYAGRDGLDDVRAILEGAPSWLKDDGVLVMEIGAHQGSEAQRLAWEGGFFSVQVGRDLAGRDRWISAKRADHTSIA